MNQPFTNRHILSGVLDAEPSAPWRWAGKRAELQFEIPEIEGQKLFAHFAISGELLKSTGPVRMRFFVDNVEVGSARYAEEGEKQFETPVPPARLRAGEPIRVALEVDKTWTSPDGVVLGFLLIGAGFKN